MANFKCPKCNKIISVSRFRTCYKNNKRININLDTNNQIYCQECNIEMNFLPEEGKYNIVYSSFSGLSPIEKQKLLRRRSDDDAKKQKYIEQDREKVHFNA